MNFVSQNARSRSRREHVIRRVTFTPPLVSTFNHVVFRLADSRTWERVGSIDSNLRINYIAEFYQSFQLVRIEKYSIICIFIYHFYKFVALREKNEPIILRPADWPTRARENASDSNLRVNYVAEFYQSFQFVRIEKYSIICILIYHFYKFVVLRKKNEPIILRPIGRLAHVGTRQIDSNLRVNYVAEFYKSFQLVHIEKYSIICEFIYHFYKFVALREKNEPIGTR